MLDPRISNVICILVGVVFGFIFGIATDKQSVRENNPDVFKNKDNKHT